jgi:hypothetical protein
VGELDRQRIASALPPPWQLGVAVERGVKRQTPLGQGGLLGQGGRSKRGLFGQGLRLGIPGSGSGWRRRRADG